MLKDEKYTYVFSSHDLSLKRSISKVLAEYLGIVTAEVFTEREVTAFQSWDIESNETVIAFIKELNNV